MKKSHFLQRVLVGIMAFLMFFSSSNSVFALSSSTLDMFAENNILFYDPSGKNSDGWCNTVVSGDNHNYAGATIFSESQMAAIQSNMKFFFSGFVLLGHRNAKGGVDIAHFLALEGTVLGGFFEFNIAKTNFAVVL